MKIQYFGADYPPTGGGIATFSKDWILQSSKQKNVLSVNASIFCNAEARIEKVNEKLTIQTFKTRNFLYIGVLVLVNIVRNIKADIFHSLNLFPVGFWVTFWSKILFRKSAVTFYGTDACSTRASRIAKMLKIWTIEKSSFAFTISEFTKNETIRLLGIWREIQVIYPLLPITRGSHKESDTQILSWFIGIDDFVILSVGRMVERKGLDLLIQAVSEIDKKDIRLVLVGDGPERSKLEELSSDLDVTDKVFFAGKEKDLEPYYKRSDLFVLLSYYIKEDGDFEGLGLVLLEAQYHGVPVIASKSGGIAEAFVDGRTGILVPEKDVNAIKNAILRMYNDREMMKKMSTEAKKFVFERFDPETNIKQYLKIIETK